MVRTASDATIVSLHVTGLTPGGQYASHVHAAPSAVEAADGRYKHDPAGPAAPPNEIWLGGAPFVANAGGRRERAGRRELSGRDHCRLGRGARPVAAVNGEQDRLRRPRLTGERAVLSLELGLRIEPWESDAVEVFT